LIAVCQRQQLQQLRLLHAAQVCNLGHALQQQVPSFKLPCRHSQLHHRLLQRWLLVTLVLHSLLRVASPGALAGWAAAAAAAALGACAAATAHV
jgi:hypothetical protein